MGQLLVFISVNIKQQKKSKECTDNVSVEDWRQRKLNLVQLITCNVELFLCWNNVLNVRYLRYNKTTNLWYKLKFSEFLF